VLDVIRRLAQEGKTVVVIEHNMSVIMEISDWVYFMDEGKVVTFGLPWEILGDPEVRRAYLGV
jgi:ABC-type branched-subunit amino acid transport system ATPase component